MLKQSVLLGLLLSACQPVPASDPSSPETYAHERDAAENSFREEAYEASSLPDPEFGRGMELASVRNVLPLNGNSFCAGVANAMKTAKQSMSEEIGVICNGSAPTAMLSTLWASPYEGVGQPTPTSIRVVPIDENTSELFLAYSMRIPKKSVQTLLGEEKHAIVPYDSGATQDPMKMSFKFLEPPKNTGDCDTSFTLEQLVQVRTNVRFDDTSKHELKLYLMHPNNWDFFMAGRTLVAPTEQFKRSVVVRGFMTDPNDPNKTIATTVLHFVMNSREQHERMTAAFMEFIRADMLALFNEQKS